MSEKLIRELYSSTEPKWPEVCVPLVGQDGNMMAIMGRCRKAVRRYMLAADYSPQEVDLELSLYTNEVFDSSYDQAIQTTMCWVDVE